MTRVSGERALVLHARPYRESSAIVSLLTAGHGRLAVVARGVRSSRRGNVLQPFNQVRVSWSGRGSLYTLTGSELSRHAWLTGNALAAGFYVAELISRLLPEHEDAPHLFDAASWTLQRLELGDMRMDAVLRVFERRLLEELGYGLDFLTEAGSGEPIRADSRYELHHEFGFLVTSSEGRGYPGRVLTDIAADRYDARETRVAARKIFRAALRPLLGDRPLSSRRLLRRERA